MSHIEGHPPGLVVLFGSGETSASGSKIFQALAPRFERPLRVCILETPAGFELNSAQVAGKVADFLSTRLQNDKPQVTVVPARKRGTAFSPDDPASAAPLRDASVVFMGAGSPTYAVRQLKGSLTWRTLEAAHRFGTAIALASAATLSVSAYTLPVYEIYKAGHEPHWHAGLNFLIPFGLNLIFVPHWNNAEGGAELDTARCFMGLARFDDLVQQLPGGHTIVGIDEHTALVMDFATHTCEVMGTGGVTVLRDGAEQRWVNKQTFAMTVLGDYRPPAANADIPPAVWDAVHESRHAAPAPDAPPEAVLALVAEREAARQSKNWPAADAARKQLAELGWAVKDTAQGPVVEKVESSR
jgi:cyanophycinase-like exopeptidase